MVMADLQHNKQKKVNKKKKYVSIAYSHLHEVIARFKFEKI